VLSFFFFFVFTFVDRLFYISCLSHLVVNTTSTGQGGYSAMMTAAPTTTSAPSMVTPSFVLPTSGGGSLGDQQQQLTSSLLANYPGLNLSGYLQSNAGQTLSNQSKC
jgi:hypothetical protein